MRTTKTAPVVSAPDTTTARLWLAHDAPVRSGAYVLYWLRGYRRADDNLALDHAAARADELGLPLVVYESLDLRYPFASARAHSFVLESAVGRRDAIESRGAAYGFFLPKTHEEAREAKALERLAQRAALVVSDWMAPSGEMTAFWTDIARRVGERVGVRVELVDDAVGPPMRLSCDKHETAARTIRPKVHRVLDASLVRADDRAVRAPRLRELSWPFEPTEPTLERIDALVRACAVDHSVSRVAKTPGTHTEGLSRLTRFVAERLGHYGARRNDMGLVGSSELSAHVHFGVLSARSIARAARASAAPEAEREAFVEELIVRRALAFNHAMTLPETHHRWEGAVPEWAQKTLLAHADDARTASPFEAWESASTSDSLWNSAQRELLRDGVIQPYARMLWGKVALTLTRSPRDAFDWLVRLNDKWALDGRDPNTYTNIGWCFGLHDHPYPERAVFGTVRCMTSRSARTKWDTDAYERRVR
jgi:deoxyribodipyrimidine photo-lyase